MSATRRRFARRPPQLIVASSLLLASLLPTHIVAASDDADADSTTIVEQPPPTRPIEINIWGVSYHLDRTRGYNENNWGLGVRYSARPHLRWLGRSGTNRLFIEVDAMSNSYKGLLLPASVGAEYHLTSPRRACSIAMSVAMTVAYYHKPTDDSTEIRWGPVPGFSAGCGRVRSNLEVLFSPSSQILDGFVGSLRLGL